MPEQLYFCSEHISVYPGANLLTAGISRSLPSKPHVKVEGALGKSIAFMATIKALQDSGEGMQSLLALIIKAISFIDPEEEKVVVNTGEASKFFILIRRLVTPPALFGHYDISIVRRERIIHSHRDTHVRPALNAVIRTFEIIQRGPARPTILEALRAFSADLDKKITTKEHDHLACEPWKAIGYGEMRGHQYFIRGLEDVKQWDEAKHRDSEMLHNVIAPTGQKAMTFGFKDVDGEIKLLGKYENATEGIVERNGKVRALRGDEGKGNRDWAIVKLSFDKAPCDVTVKARDPHHCGKCGKCIGHVDPGFVMAKGDKAQVYHV